MSTNRKESEAIDRHNAAVIGLIAERDALKARERELVAQLEEARVIAYDVIAGEVDASTKQRAFDLFAKGKV